MVKYYDFEDKQIGPDYEEKPERDFFPDEKYCMEGDKEITNSNFKLADAKAMRNKDIGGLRTGSYPPLSELADAVYWKEKGDDSKMIKYVADCDKVKADHPLI